MRHESSCIYDVYVRMFMVLVYAGLFGGAFVARMASDGIPHSRRCMVTCRRELDGVHLDSIISASRSALIIRAGFYYEIMIAFVTLDLDSDFYHCTHV